MEIVGADRGSEELEAGSLFIHDYEANSLTQTRHCSSLLQNKAKCDSR